MEFQEFGPGELRKSTRIAKRVLEIERENQMGYSWR
jgi:hypothetical protein